MQTLNECQKHIKAARALARVDDVDKDTMLEIWLTQEKRKRQELLHRSLFTAWDSARQWVQDKKEAFVTMQVFYLRLVFISLILICS